MVFYIVCVCVRVRARERERERYLEAVTAVWVGTIHSLLKYLMSTVFVLNAGLCQHQLITAVNLQIFMLILE